MKNPQQQHAEMTHPKQRRSGTLWALRIFTVAAFAANMVVNYLGTLGYFGETNAEVSNKYPTLLTPAPWAFAIWALIFSLQGVYSIYGLLPGDDDKLQYVILLNVFVPIGWIGEAVWTIIFNHELIPLSVLFITGSTFFFMTAYLRVTDPAHSLEIGTAADLLSGRDPASDAPLLLKKAFYYLIFVAATALNFGWLVVASIVNGLIVLDYLRVDVPVAAAVGLLVFANAVAVLFLAWRREAVVSLVQVWAITAIAAKQTDPTLRAVCYGSVGVLAVLVGITLLAQAVSLVRDRSRQLHRQASSGAYQMTDIFYSARQH